jgi:hypothetical protein
MRKSAAAAALALLLAATARGAPEDTGALTVSKTTVQVPVGGAIQLATDVYVPQAAGPFPVVVIRHGFARSKAFWVNWGNHLASRGFVALVPTSRAPYSPNPATDSDDQLAVLAWGVAQRPPAECPPMARRLPSTFPRSGDPDTLLCATPQASTASWSSESVAGLGE